MGDYDWRRAVNDEMTEQEMEWYHYGYWTALDVFWMERRYPGWIIVISNDSEPIYIQVNE